MSKRSRHLPPEAGSFSRPDLSSAYVQAQYSFSPYYFTQSQPHIPSHDFGFPTVQAQIANLTPTIPTYYCHQPEAVYPPGIALNSSSNLIAYHPQGYVYNLGPVVGDGLAGVASPLPISSYWTPSIMQENLYWTIPPQDPPMMGNAVSNRNMHLPTNSDNYYSAGYPIGQPPVAQQPPDQLKCQVDRLNQFFRTGNLVEISKTEFIDNVKSLFVEARRWCNFDPMKFHRDYKLPLRELADWLTMYFPDKFSKGAFEDILSLEDLELVG